MKKFNVLIVGCGNIAGGYDSSNVDSDNILTHAKAFKLHKGFLLRGCVDPNIQVLKNFSDYWGIEKTYSNLIDALKDDIKYDVISICSPTSSHYADLKMSMNLKPKLIFCEKPITNNINDAKKIINICKHFDIELVVNHTRRWNKNIQKFKHELIEKQWGKIRSVTGFYNKGILNNGTHLVDLIQYFFGEVKLINIVDQTIDLSQQDPSISAQLKSNDGININLVAGNANDFTIFELHILSEKGFISIENGGKYWRKRLPYNSINFESYKFLNDGQVELNDESKEMYFAVENIYNFLTKGEKIMSSGSSAFIAQAICNQIREASLEISN